MVLIVNLYYTEKNGFARGLLPRKWWKAALSGKPGPKRATSAMRIFSQWTILKLYCWSTAGAIRRRWMHIIKHQWWPKSSIYEKIRPASACKALYRWNLLQIEKDENPWLKSYSCATGTSQEATKKPVISMVFIAKTALTTPQLHHLRKSFDMATLNYTFWIKLRGHIHDAGYVLLIFICVSFCPFHETPAVVLSLADW